MDRVGMLNKQDLYGTDSVNGFEIAHMLMLIIAFRIISSLCIQLLPLHFSCGMVACSWTDLRIVGRVMGWLWAVALQVYPLAGPVMTFWYPLVASIMAIETRKKKDDQLWMTYWMLYSLVSTVELFAAPVIAWIPFYSAAKLVVAAWLVLPQFRGGIVLYKKFVHPYFSAATEVTFTNGERKWSTNISADGNESAALYIKKHGAEAFEALMKSATNSRASK